MAYFAIMFSIISDNINLSDMCWHTYSPTLYFVDIIISDTIKI